MKKLFVLILAAAITLSLTACDKTDNDSGSSGESSFSSTSNGSSAEHSAPAGGDNSDVPNTPYEPPKLEALKTSYNNSCCTDDGMYYFQENYFPGETGILILCI